ncbi:MAG: DUF4032 domain-containing protein [Actinomycetes bacterium]
MPLQILAAPDDPALLDLPWSTPLERWPADQLVALPRGISRHVVRFVRLGDRVYAVKEVSQDLAQKEYRLLRELERRDVPAVEAAAVISGRTAPDGEPLEPALITRHLQYSLPYRALFSQTLRPDTLNRLLDALAVLLVRLHLVGFFWGDCSLSNTLFRRDAGAFAAYLVDAETGEMHGSRASTGQRHHDLDIAQTNVFGELLDIEASGLLHPSVDPATTAHEVVRRYEGLWEELTRPETLPSGERERVDARLRRLNELGFDVAELHMQSDGSGSEVVVQPKVVDAGHHSRRLMRLTGLDVQENQARRLLNDLDCFRASLGGESSDLDEEIIAHRWLAEAFHATVQAIPPKLRGKREPAELFHEILEHRWYLSEAEGREVPLEDAARSYAQTVLPFKPDEKAVLGSRIGTPTQRYDPTADPGTYPGA